MRVFPAKDEGISIFFHDISERKQSSEELQQLKAQLEIQVEDLRRLHELNSRLVATSSVQEMLNQVLKAALELHPTGRGMISLMTPDGGALQLACSVGFTGEFLEMVKSVPCGAGACGMAFKTKQCVTVEDVQVDRIFEGYRPAANVGGFRAVHSTPLITPQGRFIGVLTVHFAEPHRPTERQVQLTTMYAQKAADLIENALLREKAQKDLHERHRPQLPSQLRDLKLAPESASRMICAICRS